MRKRLIGAGAIIAVALALSAAELAIQKPVNSGHETRSIGNAFAERAVPLESGRLTPPHLAVTYEITLTPEQVEFHGRTHDTRAIPYAVSVMLTVGVYLFSVPYRRFIYPRLWILATPISYILTALAFACIVTARSLILATWQIPQDEIVCAKLGCGRLSDWLPIIVTIGVCAMFEQRRRSD